MRGTESLIKTEDQSAQLWVRNQRRMLKAHNNIVACMSQGAVLGLCHISVKTDKLSATLWNTHTDRATSSLCSGVGCCNSVDTSALRPHQKTGCQVHTAQDTSNMYATLFCALQGR